MVLRPMVLRPMVLRRPGPLGLRERVVDGAGGRRTRPARTRAWSKPHPWFAVVMAPVDDATPYSGLDSEGQVEALRRVATEAATAFGLDVRGLTLVLHAYNTTFRLDVDDGRRLALRVNTNSHSTSANVLAQQSLLHALSTETDVVVPDPVPTRDGRWAAQVSCPEWGGPLLVTVASWLEGDDVGVCDEEQAAALGRTMARLHAHAEAFVLPPGAALPVFDEPLFGDVDLLTGRPGLDAVDAAVLRSAVDEGRRAFAEVGAGRGPILLHADLHGGNLKWHEGRLAVFDVDDCGLGAPALDLAIATFYLRDGSTVTEEALRAGYASVRALPDVSEAAFEALVASRQLLLANSLFQSTTTDLRAEAEAYLGVTVERLRRWQETGRFSRTP
jgi:Ser/Thr protein kinase RdoA (MazF antagonist)